MKVLSRAARMRNRDVASFERERRAISRLAHPHIVRVFDVGDEHIATAYIDGSDLRRRSTPGLDPASAVQITLQIASALTFAHGKGVVHRDVKPGNILIDREGNAYLSDFGLATLIHEDDAEVQSMCAGTPGFMAPEQARGEPATPAADQYGLARTLLFMLAGGSVPEDRDAALDQIPATLPPEVRSLLSRATEPEPSRRWASIADLAAALSAVDLRGYPAAQRLLSTVREPSRYAWCSRGRRVALPSPELMRLDCDLATLEDSAERRAACQAFRDATGYAAFGWSIYGNVARLGPLDDPAALARTRELVVLLHGWLCTREVWQDIAQGVCRDNGSAVVLAPDVGGFGATRFSEVVPAPQHAAPSNLGRVLSHWLHLVGLDGLPLVVLGHSMSAIGILTLEDGELGPRAVRIALTPYFPALHRVQRWQAVIVSVLVRLAGRSPALFRRLARWQASRSGAWWDLTGRQRARMLRQLLGRAPALLALLVREIGRARTPPAARLERVILVAGADDSAAPERTIVDAASRLGIPAHNVHRMATGGHFPHLESLHHPEWTARNQDELVRLIDAHLIEADQQTVEVTPGPAPGQTLTLTASARCR